MNQESEKREAAPKKCGCGQSGEKESAVMRGTITLGHHGHHHEFAFEKLVCSSACMAFTGVELSGELHAYVDKEHARELNQAILKRLGLPADTDVSDPRVLLVAIGEAQAQKKPDETVQ